MRPSPRAGVAFLAVLAFLFLSAGSSALNANTFKVREDCATIQACINLAQAGDRVLVPAGLYSENLSITKPLSLEQSPSQELGEEFVIQAIDPSQPTIHIRDAQAVEITGFTITSGDVGVLVDVQAAAKLSESTIRSNQDGVVVAPFAEITLVQNRITGNVRDGMVIEGSAQLQGNAIRNNGFDGVKILGSARLTDNNLISGNAGHGLYVAGSAKLTDNTIENNRLEGIVIWGFAQAQATSNAIRENHHGVVVWGAAEAILSENLLNQNRGDGVLLVDQAHAELHANRILNNGEWGIAIWEPACHDDAKGWSFLGTATGSDNELGDNGRGDLCSVPESILNTP